MNTLKSLNLLVMYDKYSLTVLNTTRKPQQNTRQDQHYPRCSRRGLRMHILKKTHQSRRQVNDSANINLEQKVAVTHTDNVHICSMHHGDDSINYLGHFCAFLTFFPLILNVILFPYLFDMFKLLQLTFYIVRTFCVYQLYMNVFVTWFPSTKNKYLSKDTSIISSWLFRFLFQLHVICIQYIDFRVF